MVKDIKILTIPTQISPVYSDKNGRIFHKDTMDAVLRRRGYLRPNPADRIPITPVPVRFFIDVTDYCSIMQCGGWDVDRQTLNTEKFTINSDITDEELQAMQIMYVNDRYYINIPIARQTYMKHAEYLSTCRANAICSGLEAIDGTQMGVKDILFFDIFPEK